MRTMVNLIAAAAVVVMISGCAQTVEVRINPDFYQVAEVKSDLATPAVKEVVRLQPQKVIMIMCRNTPNKKIMQFVSELQAQSKAKIEGMHTDQDCPA